MSDRSSTSAAFRGPVLLVSTALLLAMGTFLGSGCERKIRWFRDRDDDVSVKTSSAGTEATAADAQVDLLLPRKIDVLDFTKPASFDDDSIPDGIEVVLRPLDSFGDQTKAIGQFRFELYTFLKATADHRGQRLELWEADLTSKSAQQRHWDRITRTYRFRLLWTGPQPTPGEYVLEVTYTSPWGRRLHSTYILEARLPRAEIKRKMEKRQKRLGLF